MSLVLMTSRAEANVGWFPNDIEAAVPYARRLPPQLRDEEHAGIVCDNNPWTIIAETMVGKWQLRFRNPTANSVV